MATYDQQTLFLSSWQERFRVALTEAGKRRRIKYHTQGAKITTLEKEMAMASFIDRMRRAALLDTALYEEVEADPNATWQAVGVVVVSSLAAGIGSGTSYGIGGMIGWTMVVLIGWYIWAYLTYIIGSKLLPEPQTNADHGELLRTIGFSSAPGVLRILGIIPGLTGIVFAIVGVWMLVAMIIAVRQALDYSSIYRAIGVCSIGWLVILLLVFIFASPLSSEMLMLGLGRPKQPIGLAHFLDLRVRAQNPAILGISMYRGKNWAKNLAKKRRFWTAYARLAQRLEKK